MTILSTVIRNAGVFSVALVSIASQQKISTNSVTQERQKQLNHAITQVATQQYIPFVFANLNLSNKELLAFKHLKLKNKITCPGKTLDYDSTCNTSRDKFLLSIRKILKMNFFNDNDKLDSIHITAQSIFNIVNDTLKAYNKPLAIIMIRSSLKAPFSTNHRWHQDGNYFGLIPDKNLVKASFVLKGPGTDFINYSDEYYNHDFSKKLQMEQLKAFKLTNHDFSKKLQIGQVKAFKSADLSSLSKLIPNPKFRSSSVGKIAFFKVGGNKHDISFAAIHSEPIVDGERLFVAVIPGSVKDFKDCDFLKRRIGRADFICTRTKN